MLVRIDCQKCPFERIARSAWSTEVLRAELSDPCRYIARLGKGSISVYELPDMGLLDKKSLKLEGVHEFAWSPSQPILCAYQTEQAGGNLPARISLIGFPDKMELRQKNLFSVSGERLSHGVWSDPNNSCPHLDPDTECQSQEDTPCTPTVQEELRTMPAVG